MTIYVLKAYPDAHKWQPKSWVIGYFTNKRALLKAIRQHVIRDIENLIKQTASVRQSPNLGSAKMFIKTSYQAEKGGRSYPMYLLNRDGFSLLVMSFTGEKAMEFKLKFIAEFNRMEQALKSEWQRLRRTGIDEGRNTPTNSRFTTKKPSIARWLAMTTGQSTLTQKRARSNWSKQITITRTCGGGNHEDVTRNSLVGGKGRRR